MFGNPIWFREKSIGWGLRPVTWQGWAYTLAWIGTICVPFAALVSRHQAPEALIWLSSLMGLLVWDVWGIRRSLRGTTKGREVLYIDEDGVAMRREPPPPARR